MHYAATLLQGRCYYPLDHQCVRRAYNVIETHKDNAKP